MPDVSPPAIGAPPQPAHEAPSNHRPPPARPRQPSRRQLAGACLARAVPAVDCAGVLAALVDTDPTEGRHAYLPWQAQEIVKGTSVADVILFARAFHQCRHQLPKKDLGAYASVRELRDALDEAATLRETSERKKVKFKTKAARRGLVPVYEDESVVVTRAWAANGVCPLGAGITCLITTL